MKTTEITRISKEIIPQLNNSYWGIYNESMIIEPVNELLRGVYFNKSGVAKSQFELCYFIQPLYVPFNFINLSFGDNIKTPNNKQWWEFDNNILEQLSNTITPLINRVDSNFLSQIDDAENFYKFYKSDKKKTIRHFEAVAYSAAYSNLNIANDTLTDFLSFLRKREEMKLDWVKQIYFNTEKLLEGGNPKSILNDWEIETRVALKL